MKYSWLFITHKMEENKLKSKDNISGYAHKHLLITQRGTEALTSRNGFATHINTFLWGILLRL